MKYSSVTNLLYFGKAMFEKPKIGEVNNICIKDRIQMRQELHLFKSTNTIYWASILTKHGINGWKGLS